MSDLIGNTGSALNSTISNVRKRASKARRLAHIFVLSIITIASVILYLFISTTPSPRDLVQVVPNIESISDGPMTVYENIFWFVLPPILLRIGAVLLAMYLIQILVSFTKYNFRMADHLDATAEAFEIAKLDDNLLSKALDMLAAQYIGFAKTPPSPSDKGIEIVREAISKIPSK